MGNYETEVITLTLLYNISVAIHMEDSRYKGLEWQVISNPRNTLINEENYALVTKVYLNSIFSFNSVSLYNHRIYYNEDNKILQI